MEARGGRSLMKPHMENPALAGTGFPKSDQADGSIASEDTKPLRYFQAHKLTRRCAISLAMAAIVAPLLHGEVT
jgi:hypothetical protein